MYSRAPVRANSLTGASQWEEPIALDLTLPVLVVDDQQIMVELTRRILARLGFEHVNHTADGHLALAMLREGKYKLVISDLHMDAMGGIQLLRAVRADDQLKTIRFLLMTGSAGVPSVMIAKQAGQTLIS
jgi:two-component system chemotaxis response regulator CheY